MAHGHCHASLGSPRSKPPLGRPAGAVLSGQPAASPRLVTSRPERPATAAPRRIPAAAVSQPKPAYAWAGSGPVAAPVVAWTASAGCPNQVHSTASSSASVTPGHRREASSTTPAGLEASGCPAGALMTPRTRNGAVSPGTPGLLQSGPAGGRTDLSRRSPPRGRAAGPVAAASALQTQAQAQTQPQAQAQSPASLPEVPEPEKQVRPIVGSPSISCSGSTARHQPPATPRSTLSTTPGGSTTTSWAGAREGGSTTSWVGARDTDTFPTPRSTPQATTRSVVAPVAACCSPNSREFFHSGVEPTTPRPRQQHHNNPGHMSARSPRCAQATTSPRPAWAHPSSHTHSHGQHTRQQPVQHHHHVQQQQQQQQQQQHFPLGATALRCAAPEPQSTPSSGSRARRRSGQTAQPAGTAPASSAPRKPRRPSAAEQRRICERLSKGYRGNPRHYGLMQRLNESASWLSDVSMSSDDEDVAKQSVYAEALQNPLCLAQAINESATWLDTDGLELCQDEPFVACDEHNAPGSQCEQPGGVDPADCGARRIVRSCSY